MTERDPIDLLSRFANQPERPAPDFRHRLLDELLTDLTADRSTATDQTMEVTMLAPDRNEPPTRRRTWLAIAAVIAALALIGGLIVAGTRADEDPVPADEPEVELEEGAVEPLPFAGSDVEPGTYETDLLGVPLTFNVPETMNLRTATQNRVLLTDVFDTTVWPPPATARTLSFSRISGWNTPEEAVDLEYVGPGSIDPNDIDAWAAANDLDASIPPCCQTVVFGDEVPDRVPTRLARREATPLNVRIDPAATTETFECGEDLRCAWAASLSDGATAARFDKDPVLVAGQINQFWVLHLDGEEPLLMHVSAAESDEAWLDLVSDTVLFDESLPIAEPVPVDEPDSAAPEVEAAPAFATGDTPAAMVFDGTSLWIANINDNTVSKLDPADGTRVDYETGEFPSGVTFDGTSVWVTNQRDGTVSKIDPEDGTRVDFATGTSPAPNPLGVAFDGTNIWITNGADSTVSKMNPDDGTRTDFPTADGPAGVTFDGTSIWITHPGVGTVSKMNPDDGTRVEYPAAGTLPSQVTFDGTSIWITNSEYNTVTKMNPDDGTRIDDETGAQPVGIVFDGTSIWVTNQVDATVSQINPVDGTLVDYPTGNIPRGVVFDGTNIWVANGDDDTVSKITPG